MERLTHQEEEAMLYIWEIEKTEPLFVIKDILNKYPEPRPPYTTVASIVRKLKNKGYLNAKLYGNLYVYSTIISQSEYKSMFMVGMVRNYFANSYKEMVSFFAKEQKLSTNDLKDIINQIEKGKEQ